MIKTLAIACLLLPATLALAADRYVPTPDCTWLQLAPYLEANLHVEYADGRVTVGTSGAPFERDLVRPYDDVLGEFAKVLLSEVLEDGKINRLVQKAAGEAGKEFRGSGEPTRDELAAAIWRRLAAADRFDRLLLERFRRAQDEGRLRCTICDHGYVPRHLAVE